LLNASLQLSALANLMEINIGVAVNVEYKRLLFFFWDVGHSGSVYKIALVPKWAYHTVFGTGLTQVIFVSVDFLTQFKFFFATFQPVRLCVANA